MSAQRLNDTKEDGIVPFAFVLVAVFFLLSGASSLVYQVIWSRMLVFVFGSSTFATSTVLAVFMAGLAAGSLFAGAYADRSKNQLSTYAILEGLIGLWALAAPLMFQAAAPIYKQFFESLHESPLAFAILRFFITACILLPPTFCMGATLPILARFVTSSLQTVSNKVGALYAFNTLGAVIGSIAGGFWLLPSFGLNQSTIIAAASNFILALSTLAVSRMSLSQEKSKYKPGPVDETGSNTEAEPIAKHESQAKPESELEKQDTETGKHFAVDPALAVSFGFAISGAVSMIYEVAWTRSLLMVIGSTTYAFTIMLSTFLVGIFLGSYFSSRFADRAKNAALWFGLAQIYVGLGGFLSIKLFGFLPLWNLELSYYLGKDPGYGIVLRFLMASAVLLPISLNLGASFPLAVKVCTSDLKRVGRSVGNLYFFNTLGAIFGALLAGFLIIPALGTERTLILNSMINLSLGLPFLLIYGSLRLPIKALSIAGIFALALWAANSPGLWDRNSVVFAQSDKRRLPAAKPNETLGSFSKWREQAGSLGKVIYYKDGLCANVAVAVSEAENGRKITSLFTSGHADASDDPDMDNQVMLAVFPLLVRPQAEDVCVVGWGSGVTAGYALRFDIKKLACAEIEALVFQTSKFFHHVNFAAENDKRTELEPSDGRNFLLSSPAKFDVIISEPSNPWQAGVCNLFTKEYFQICKNSLKENGVFSMWTQINEIPTENLKQIFSALSEVFPQAYVMDSGHGDLVTIAVKKPGKLSYDSLQELLSKPGLKADLRPFSLESPEDFIARLQISPSQLAFAVQESEANSDDRNYLEYAVARSYENAMHVDENYKWLLAHAGKIWDSIDWGRLSKKQIAEKMNMVSISCAKRNIGRALIWAEHSMEMDASPDTMSLICELKIKAEDLPSALKSIAEAERLYPQDARFPGLAGICAYKQGRFSEARELLQKSVSAESTNLIMRYYLASAIARQSKHATETSEPAPGNPQAKAETSELEKILALCSPALDNPRFVDSTPDAAMLYAETSIMLGKPAQALAAVLKVRNSQANKSGYWKLLAQAHSSLKEQRKAMYCWNNYSRLLHQELALLEKELVSVPATNAEGASEK